MPRLRPEHLEQLSRDIFLAMGSAPEEADAVADHLVKANLAGHDSHGVGMLPTYVRLFGTGRLRPNQALRPVVDSGALLVFDAGLGVGQHLAATAVGLAADRAATLGACVLGVRDAGHIGRVGAYGELCAARGMAFVAFVNVARTIPVQATWGGADARLGTNPFSAAVPRAGAAPVLLDMATTTIAFGKARVAHNKGHALPEGVAIDAEGRPTTDPAPLVTRREGALLSFGQHKGSGLAIICELLAAALTGGERADGPDTEGVGNSMLAVIIDLARLGADAAAIEAVCRHVLGSPAAPGHASVQLPGDPEQASARARRVQGIEVDETSWAEIVGAAAQLGVRTTG